jgi:hypothetical protein
MGWYRIEVINDTSAADGTFSVKQTYGGNTVWCNLVLPGYMNNINNVSKIRVTGMSLQWRNTTADQYVNGRVAAVQFGKGQSVTEVISGGPQAMFQFISSSREGVTRDFKKGFYGFLKPAEDNDLAYTRPLTANTSLVWSGGEPLSRRSGFIAAVAQVVSGSGAPASNTQMRRRANVEYQTNNLWAEVRFPSVDRRVWEQACATIGMIPQFHENPSHWAEIVASIMNGGANLIDNVGPTLRQQFGDSGFGEVVKFLQDYVAPGLRQLAPGAKQLVRTFIDDDDLVRKTKARRIGYN